MLANDGGALLRGNKTHISNKARRVLVAETPGEGGKSTTKDDSRFCRNMAKELSFIVFFKFWIKFSKTTLWARPNQTPAFS